MSGQTQTTDPQPTAEPRRATDAEIAIARAWIAEHKYDGCDLDGRDPNNWDREDQDEYETVLEALIFANGGRFGDMHFDGNGNYVSKADAR